jgi:hypothetical protein
LSIPKRLSNNWSTLSCSTTAHIVLDF